MDEVSTRGYLQEDFRLFHISDTASLSGIESHYHNFHKLIFVEGGSIDYTVEGRHYSLCAGDLALVPMGSIHRPESAGGVPYSRYVLYLGSSFLKDSTSPLDLCFTEASERHQHIFRLQPEQSAFFLEKLQEIESAAGNLLSYAASLLSKLLVKQLLISLCRLSLSEVQPSPVRYDKKISAVIAYISANLSSDLSIDTLAGRFYFSKYHLMRRFHEETGYSIHRYISEKRLLYARELIGSGHSATEACFLCGYKEYSSFARAYRKQFSHSPKVTEKA